MSTVLSTPQKSSGNGKSVSMLIVISTEISEIRVSTEYRDRCLIHILCNRHLGVHLSVINKDYKYIPMHGS